MGDSGGGVVPVRCGKSRYSVQGGGQVAPVGSASSRRPCSVSFAAPTPPALSRDGGKGFGNRVLCARDPGRSLNALLHAGKEFQEHRFTPGLRSKLAILLKSSV
jgi:hypothetical protein